MIKRSVVMIAALLAACFLPISPSGPVSLEARAIPNVVASRYDVTIDLQPDGSLDVVERITLRAGAKPMTWFERQIPAGRTDGLTGATVLVDGHELPLVDKGPGARIRTRESGIDLRVEFDPIANGERVIEVRYRALHVVAPSADGPRLVWGALPARHDYPIEHARVTLRAPERTLAVAIVADGADLQPAVSWSQGQLITRDNLSAKQTITLDVILSARTFSPVEPEWSVQAERAQRMLPAFLIAGITLIAVGIGIVVMVQARSGGAVNESADQAGPADSLEAAPAIASVLVNRGHAPGWLALQAAFFALVRDGQLVVEKTGDGQRFKSPAFAVTLGETRSAAPHEQWILDGVRGQTGVADLKRLMSAFARRQREFTSVLLAEMTSQGLLDVDRAASSRGLTVTGIVLLTVSLLAGGLTAALAVPRLGPGVLAIPGALFADALVFLIAGNALSRLTESGMRAGARWRARLDELRRVIGAKDDARSLSEFERWLPVAIGAGEGGRWLKAFDAELRASGRDLAWLRAMGSADDAHHMLATMVAVSGATSHGGGGAGAAGAAGGGSSSAG